MSKTGKQILIIASSMIAVGGATYLVYNRFRKLNMIDRINQELDSEGKAISESSGTQSTADISTGVGSAAWNRSALPVDRVIEYGKKIYESKGTFYDNEDVIYSTIQKLKNKIQVSQVNQYVQSRNGGVDMLLWLQQFMDKKAPSGELYYDLIVKHISRLPKTS